MFTYFKTLFQLIFKPKLIMANLQDVENQIVVLQASVDLLQEKVITTIAALQAAADSATGLSSADAQNLIDQLQTVQATVEGILPTA